MSAKNIRRASSLVCYWDSSGFTVENYLTRTKSEINPFILNALNFLEDWCDIDVALKKVGLGLQSLGLFEKLISQDILVVQGSKLDVLDRAVSCTWRWDIRAQYFHFGCKDAIFNADLEEQRCEVEKYSSLNPAPSPFKNYSNDYLSLTGEFRRDYDGVKNALISRRTCRSFKDQPISFDQFSNLLLWTWGKTEINDSNPNDLTLLKTSPSGGARHPIEVYPVVLNIDNLKSGLYHYSVEKHSISMLKSGQFNESIVQICGGHEWLKNTAAVFLMTAVIDRSSWKYSHPHAYKVIYLDAGHLGQTFQLLSTEVGLQSFVTAAINSEIAENFLDIDGIEEFAVYSCAIGNN